jgi:hypothetical protein
VLFLPETGIGYATGGALPLWPAIVLPSLGLVLGWVVYRNRRNK